MIGERFSLKDYLFNKKKVVYLATLITNVYPQFEEGKFITQVIKKFPELELKERIVWIREQLRIFLPDEYPNAINILIAALPDELDPCKADDDFGDFIFAPLSDFVATYGCTKEYLKISLTALEEMTKRFSCEDSIRYFLNEYEKETLQIMIKWSKHKNYHVRRLASEGSRPLLPWSQRVDLDNNEVIENILNNLYYDTTRYVVRSVANHLNDISKADGGLVLKTLSIWEKSKKQNVEEMEYLKRHALRTLIKKGDKNAMEFLGYIQEHGIKISDFKSESKKISLGEPLYFSLNIKAEKDVRVLVDYIIEFASKNGKNRRKVFRLKDIYLKAGEKKHLKKKHPLRADMTTFKIYPGRHTIILQINGVESEKINFEIID